MSYLEIALSGIIWASTGPILRSLESRGFSPIDIVLGRALFSLLFMGAVLLFLHYQKSRRKHLPQIYETPLVPCTGDIPVFLALGFLAVVLSQVTYFYALSLTSVAVAVTLNYTAPFFVMVISHFVYKEPITRDKVISLVSAMIGVMLVSGFIGQDFRELKAHVLGIVTALLSGASYGLQTVVYKKVGTRYGPLALNFYTMASGSAILLLGLSIIQRRIPTILVRLCRADLTAWLLFAMVGLGPGAIAFILFSHGINKVEATKGSIVAMSEPIAACFIGYFVLGENLSWTQVLGVVLVLGAIISMSISGIKSRSSRSLEA